MSRTMIDLDDEMVEHAMRLYGVKTKAKAVRMAMEEAVKRRLRQEGIEPLVIGDCSGVGYIEGAIRDGFEAGASVG